MKRDREGWAISEPLLDSLDGAMQSTAMLESCSKIEPNRQRVKWQFDHEGGKSL